MRSCFRLVNDAKMVAVSAPDLSTEASASQLCPCGDTFRNGKLVSFVSRTFNLAKKLMYASSRSLVRTNVNRRSVILIADVRQPSSSQAADCGFIGSFDHQALYSKADRGSSFPRMVSIWPKLRLTEVMLAGVARR